MDVQRLAHPCPGYEVTQEFGENPEYYAPWGLDGHNGKDYGTPVGTSFRAMHDGQVVWGDNADLGLYIYLVGVYGDSIYAHLSDRLVNPGTPITLGSQIGLSGATGNVTGPHLHVGYRPRPFALGNGFRGWIDFTNLILKAHVNKVFPHCQHQPYPSWLKESCHEAQGTIPFVCLIEPPNRDYFPFQRTIGRLWMGSDEDERAYVRRGRQGGIDYYNDNRQRYWHAPYVWAWRGPCEPFVRNAVERQQLLEFYQAFLPLAQRDGYRIIGPDLGVTWPGGYVPPQANWTEFIYNDVAELRWIYENVDYCSGHHYGLRDGTHWTQWDGWTMRFRYVIQALKEMGATLKPWVLTEGGLDIRGDPDTSGWRGPGHGEINLYTNQIIQVNHRLQQDALIEGYGLFVFPPTGWPSFRIERNDWRDHLFPNLMAFGIPPEPIPDELWVILDDRLRRVEIPITETHALFREAQRRWPGCWPKSDELETDEDGRIIVAQRFYVPYTRKKHALYTVKGDWNPEHFGSFTVDN